MDNMACIVCRCRAFEVHNIGRRTRVPDFGAFAVTVVSQIPALVRIREVLDRDVSGDLQEDTEDNGVKIGSP